MDWPLYFTEVINLPHIFVDWSLYFCSNYSLLGVSAVLYKIFPVLRMRCPSALCVCKRATWEAQGFTVYPLAIKRVIKQGEMPHWASSFSLRGRENSDICNPVLNASKLCLFLWEIASLSHRGSFTFGWHLQEFCQHSLLLQTLCQFWHFSLLENSQHGSVCSWWQTCSHTGSSASLGSACIPPSSIPQLCLHSPSWPGGNRSLSQSHSTLEAGSAPGSGSWSRHGQFPGIFLEQRHKHITMMGWQSSLRALSSSSPNQQFRLIQHSRGHTTESMENKLSLLSL